MKAIKSAIEKGYEARYVADPYKRDDREIYEYLELCLIQRWLREKGIIVDVAYFGEDRAKWETTIYSQREPLLAGYCNTYEQALEAGIFKAVELIK